MGSGGQEEPPRRPQPVRTGVDSLERPGPLSPPWRRPRSRRPEKMTRGQGLRCGCKAGLARGTGSLSEATVSSPSRSATTWRALHGAWGRGPTPGPQRVRVRDSHPTVSAPWPKLPALVSARRHPCNITVGCPGWLDPTAPDTMQVAHSLPSFPSSSPSGGLAPSWGSWPAPTARQVWPMGPSRCAVAQEAGASNAPAPLPTGDDALTHGVSGSVVCQGPQGSIRGSACAQVCSSGGWQV